MAPLPWRTNPRGFKGAKEKEREWKITPQPEGTLLVVTCLHWVPRDGEAVMQATECWWQKHLRSPVSRRGDHPTSPTAIAPWLYDSVYMLRLYNITIPTVGKTIWSTLITLTLPLLLWAFSACTLTHAFICPSIHPSISTTPPKSTSATMRLDSLHRNFVKKVSILKPKTHVQIHPEQSTSQGQAFLLWPEAQSVYWVKRITPFWQQRPWSVCSVQFKPALERLGSEAFCWGYGSMPLFSGDDGDEKGIRDVIKDEIWEDDVRKRRMETNVMG